MPIDPDHAYWDGGGGTSEIPDDSRQQARRQIILGASQDRDRVQRSGIDVLAWYRPFHVFRQTWGIYLTVSGIRYVAAEVLRIDPRTPLERGIEVAITALLRHEEFHYQVEVYATGHELATGVPTYRRFQHRFQLSGHLRRAESLANRRMVTHNWSGLGGASTKQAVETVADAGPLDYAHWRAYAPADRYAEAKSALAAEVIEADAYHLPDDPPCSMPAGSGPVPPRYAFFPGRQLSTPIWKRHQVPLYLIQDVSRTSTFGGIFFANVSWKQLRLWARKALPDWYFPAKPGPHKGKDSKIWPTGQLGVGYGISITIHDSTNAVSPATLDEIAKHAKLPLSAIGRRVSVVR